LIDPDYTIIISEETRERLYHYLEEIKSGIPAGAYLSAEIDKIDQKSIHYDLFLEALLNTKRPQIFAESQVYGNGVDWTLAELGFLGDISIATPVTIYDNGLHESAALHEEPFKGCLVFVPGALLRNDTGEVPADWNEITCDGVFDPASFFNLYERRLRPVFSFIDQRAGHIGRKAFITVPGIGCGQFAGEYRGQLGHVLRRALINIIEKYGSGLTNIKAVYYDPYDEWENERKKIHDIDFFCRPLRQGNADKPQLCLPSVYEESGDDFSSCELYSFVAWDHVSWPGNDFYAGARATDDGVKAAATNAMKVMTGVTGHYDKILSQYLPPERYENWRAVVKQNKLRLKVHQNLFYA